MGSTAHAHHRSLINPWPLPRTPPISAGLARSAFVPWHSADDFRAAANCVCCRGSSRPAAKIRGDRQTADQRRLPKLASSKRLASVRAYHLQHIGTITLELALADAADLR